MKFTILSTLALLAATATASANVTITGVDGRARSIEEIQAISSDGDTNRQCQQQNGGYIPTLKAGQYAASKFHNCFHTADQIYEFVDALASQNPTLLTKEAISTTYQGKTIYGYKLSNGARSQSLYFQAMQHAREWVAGSSLLFSLSSILDDIANN
ncbi:hypothetical protein As57867_003406, partial [Aphanomyces stellatus]